MPICVQNAPCMCEPMLRTHLDQKYISFPTPWNQVWGKQNSQCSLLLVRMLAVISNKIPRGDYSNVSWHNWQPRLWRYNPSYAPIWNPKKNKMYPPHQKNLLLNQLRHCITRCDNIREQAAHHIMALLFKWNP